MNRTIISINIPIIYVWETQLGFDYPIKNYWRIRYHFHNQHWVWYSNQRSSPWIFRLFLGDILNRGFVYTQFNSPILCDVVVWQPLTEPEKSPPAIFTPELISIAVKRVKVNFDKRESGQIQIYSSKDVRVASWTGNVANAKQVEDGTQLKVCTQFPYPENSRIYFDASIFMWIFPGSI